jgi:hypothetical protein
VPPATGRAKHVPFVHWSVEQLLEVCTRDAQSATVMQSTQDPARSHRPRIPAAPEHTVPSAAYDGRHAPPLHTGMMHVVSMSMPA